MKRTMNLKVGKPPKIRTAKKPPAASAKVRPPKAAAPAAGRVVDTGDNDEVQGRFLDHRSQWNQWKAARKVVDKRETEVKAALKADGFLVKEFEVADALTAGPKQAAKIREEVTLRLRVARWMHLPMGDQLDLFVNSAPPPPPNHREAGKVACMEGQRATPPDHLAADDVQEWLAGYHDEQGRKTRAGIRPLAGDGTMADDEGDPDDGALGEPGSDDGNPLVSAERERPNPARPLGDFDDPPDVKH